MTETHRKPIWLKMGVLVSALAVFLTLIHGIHLRSSKSVETAIAQNLGPESDATSVREFMAGHHILFVGCSSALRTCYGKIYRTSISLLTKSYILIDFNFDENGKLISHKVHERHQFVWE